MIGSSLKQGCRGGGVNLSFLDLIPKESNPSSSYRLCSISLCNVSSKVISKILIERLKKLLPSIISNNQGGFLLGSKIFENINLVQESILSSRSRGGKGIYIKINMENSFDGVTHNFLFKTMGRMGFDNAFI